MRKLLYEISHFTSYDYFGSVSVSHHLLRLRPRRLPNQRVFSHEVVIEPQPAVVSEHADYFGNQTQFVTVEGAHSRLVIQSRSKVAVGPLFVPEPTETSPWESVRTACRIDHAGSGLEAHEFTYGSPLAPLQDAYADYASVSFTRQRPLLEAVLDLTRRINKEFAFDPTATNVATPIADFYRKRRGVCQDFAQFEIACLRSLGLPARYVSGYLESDPPPGQPKLRGVDASHAWVSFYCPGVGWIDVDPTNNCIPSLRHITIGWGRDYSDVAPIKGVIIGGQGQALTVGVDVVAQGVWEPSPNELTTHDV
ncbi:transglutaminase family protein [bacterium]|nr:transglutaminase family protein [bacterium]